MSGTLFHSREFAAVDYVGGDGLKHFESHSVDGDSMSVGHTTWNEMKRLAHLHGMPLTSWPEFLDCDFGIDVPLAEVAAKQDVFQEHLLKLPQSVLDQHHRLAEVAGWVRRGEAVFFCGN